MLCEVCVESRGIIVLLAIFTDHWIKFLQISLSEVVKLNLYSIEECLSPLFDQFQCLLSGFAVKGCNVDDFSISVNMIPRPRRKQSIALALLFELIKVISWFRSLNWLELINDSQ